MLLKTLPSFVVFLVWGVVHVGLQASATAHMSLDTVPRGGHDCSQMGGKASAVASSYVVWPAAREVTLSNAEEESTAGIRQGARMDDI